MRIFPKVLAVAATALTLGVAAPASAHWYSGDYYDRWGHRHNYHRHHHHHHGWHRPYYAPRYSYSYGYRYVPPQPYYYRW